MDAHESHECRHSRQISLIRQSEEPEVVLLFLPFVRRVPSPSVNAEACIHLSTNIRNCISPLERMQFTFMGHAIRNFWVGDSTPAWKLNQCTDGLWLQMTYVNKAGWLYKRGRLQRRWVRRWFSVNSHKCSFKYCNSPGPVSRSSPTTLQLSVHSNMHHQCALYILLYLVTSTQEWMAGRAGQSTVGCSQPRKAH